MTTLTLETTNQILAAAGISLRVSHKGLAAVAQVPLFEKALHFCQKNAKARDDVLNILVDYKEQPDMVFVAERPKSQPMLDAVPAQNNMDSPSPRQAPRYSTNQSAQQNEKAAASAQQPGADQNVPPATKQGAAHPNAPVNTDPGEAGNNKESDNEETEQRSYVGHHVYGNKSALYFAYDETRSGDATIAIDGAMSSGVRQYDWSKKLRIQITRSDLPSVAAVFFGLLPKVELSNYGADNTKRLMVENQGKNYFLNMSAKDHHQIAVPISAADVFEIRGLFLAQLVKNRPEIGIEGMLANLKCHAVMLKQG